MQEKTNHGSMKEMTIDQMLSSFGEKLVDENLNIYLQKQSISHFPIYHPFRLDHFTILIIDKGEFKIKLNLIEYTLKKDDLIIVLPHSLGQFISLSNDLLFKSVSFSAKTLMTLGMEPHQIDSFNFLSSQYPGNVGISKKESSGLRMLMQLLARKNKLNPDYPFKEEIILNCFRLFLYEVSAIFKNNSRLVNHYTRREMLFHEFTKLLLQYLPENRTLKFYADHLSVTTNYLTKLTKISTGKTAGALIDEMVILHSKLLLHQMSLSVAEVSQQLFFSDQFIFSRFFKKNAGLSPSAYRKQRM